MGLVTSSRTRIAAVLIAASCMALAACGGSSETSSTGGGGGSSQFDSASLTRAKAGIAQYLGKPSPITVTEPLKKRPKAGGTIIFLNCGNAECQEYYPGLQAAAKALGYKTKQVNAGLSPQTVGAAVDSAIQQNPAGIFDPGLDPFLFQQQLKTLQAKHIPVVANAIPEPPGNGISAELAGSKSVFDVGKSMADYVYTQEGNKADAVFVDSPQIQLSLNMAKGFISELKSLCPQCKASELKVTAASIGTTLPRREVSYLQQHPSTNWLVNFAGGLYIGVPQALKAAGIKVKSLSQSGGPVNMQYLKAGLQTADLTFDYGEVGWMAMDMFARLNTGQPIPAAEQGNYVPGQLLTQRDITFDPAGGFVAYPDYEARYKRLWGLGS